jgi:predicted RNA-binding protein with PUA-like domain
MAKWLLKTEPDSFSWADQLARGAEGEPWTGVRNHQARNFLAAMAIGDEAFFYHTGDDKCIVGVVEVTEAAFPDPTDMAWVAVTVVAKAPLARPVSLAELKLAQVRDPELSGLFLLKNPRLSVQPVSEAEWGAIIGYSRKGPTVIA